MLKKLLFIFLSLIGYSGYTQGYSLDTPNDFSAAFLGGDSLTVIKELQYLVIEKGKVMITWKISEQIPEFIVIERSDNGKRFETVSVLNHLSTKPVYQWIDDSPKKGKNFYRIRYSSKEGIPVYSPTVVCQIEGYVFFKFYPNPVDQILIVRSDIPIDVIIADGNGKIRVTHPKISGLQTLNVSSLEKGIYIIRFIDRHTNTISQEKLVKN
ncbi:MAG: T9SS type A sorting domain-containing protein [Chitinophagaceae bacterium]|nr:T9SS type A sorting domain-containing protein [Chitinophagaceae bacterium]